MVRACKNTATSALLPSIRPTLTSACPVFRDIPLDVDAGRHFGFNQDYYGDDEDDTNRREGLHPIIIFGIYSVLVRGSPTSLPLNMIPLTFVSCKWDLLSQVGSIIPIGHKRTCLFTRRRLTDLLFCPISSDSLLPPWAAIFFTC